jgi:hypothetical protein
VQVVAPATFIDRKTKGIEFYEWKSVTVGTGTGSQQTFDYYPDGVVVGRGFIISNTSVLSNHNYAYVNGVRTACTVTQTSGKLELFFAAAPISGAVITMPLCFNKLWNPLTDKVYINYKYQPNQIIPATEIEGKIIAVGTPYMLSVGTGVDALPRHYGEAGNRYLLSVGGLCELPLPTTKREYDVNEQDLTGLGDIYTSDILETSIFGTALSASTFHGYSKTLLGQSIHLSGSAIRGYNTGVIASDSSNSINLPIMGDSPNYASVILDNKTITNRVAYLLPYLIQTDGYGVMLALSLCYNTSGNLKLTGDTSASGVYNLLGRYIA